MWLPWGINVKHLYLAFFSIVSIALCSFTMIIYNQYRTVEDLNAYTIQQYEAIRQTRLILLDVVDMETGVRGYVISADPKFLETYAAVSGRVRAELFGLRNATYRDGAFFAETNVWLDRIEDLQKLLNAQVASVQTHGRGAVAVADLEVQRQRMDALRALMDKSVRARLDDLKKHIKDVESQKSNFSYILIIVTFLGIGIVLAGTVTIINLESENQTIEDENKKDEARFRMVMTGIND